MAAVPVVLLVLAPAARALPSPVSTVSGISGDEGERNITYVGVIEDRVDLHHGRIGRAGSWFPRFDVPGEGGTGAHAIDALPDWVGPFNHATITDPGCHAATDIERGCLPTYQFRTFSGDGPAQSAGSTGWAALRLPTGECGRSGAIVDPHTHVGKQEYDDPTGLVFPRQPPARPNNNNTINRIQLQGEVPSTFYVAVLTDNTAGSFDPGVLELRGNVGLLDAPEDRSQVDEDDEDDEKAVLVPFNGVPDLYVFEVAGFVSGDYLKLRLAGDTAPASFGGLLFDEEAPRISGRGPARLPCSRG